MRSACSRPPRMSSGRVVHPRVVGAQLAQADEQQREARGRRRWPTGMRSSSERICGGSRRTRSSAWRTLPRRTPVGMWRLGHDPARLLEQLLQVEPAAAQPVEVAARTRCAAAVDSTCGLSRIPSSPSAAQLRERCRARSRCAREIASMTSHSSRDSPLGGTTASVYCTNGRRVEAEERERQVVALVEARRREDVVGVAVGLVDVEVDRDAQVELSSARSSASPSGHESTGLPADTNSARSRPGPGVSISAASATRASRRSRRGSRRSVSASRRRCRARSFSATSSSATAGRPNTAPPGSSRLPVTALSASSRKLTSVPKRPRHEPVRP